MDLCRTHSGHRCSRGRAVKSPWVAFSFHDLFDCRYYARMTAVQQAIYWAMLGEQATGGPLPEDPSDLAFFATRRTRDLSEDDFLVAWVPPLTDCFTSGPDGLINPRMAHEAEMAEARSRNGRAAIDARWAKEKKGGSTPVSPPKNDSATSTGHNRTGQDRTQEEEGANAPAPQAEQTTRRKRTNRLANLNEACDKIEAPGWLRTALSGYMTARKDAKFKPWSVALWIDEAKQVLPMGEEAGSRLCMKASKKPWAMIVYEDQSGSNAQQASAQAPSRAGAVQPSKFTRTLSRTEKNGHVSTLMRAYAEIEGHAVKSTAEMMAWGWAKEYAFMPDLDQREAYKPKPERQPDLIIQPDLKQLPY